MTRQRSTAGPITVEIPRPTQSVGLLNKSASSSSSLYHQCSQLRSRLQQIPDFNLFFEQTASEQNQDPVSHLWDTLALGVPLCYLYNLLPPPTIPIDIECNPNQVNLDPSNVKAAKKSSSNKTRHDPDPFVNEFSSARRQSNERKIREGKRVGGRSVGMHLTTEVAARAKQLRDEGSCWICCFQRDSVSAKK